MVCFERDDKQLIIPTGLGNFFRSYGEGYDEGYQDGIATGANLQPRKSVSMSQSGLITPDAGYDAMEEVYVEIQGGGGCNLEEVSISLSESAVTVTPDYGYDGMSRVAINAKPYGDLRYDEGYAAASATSVQVITLTQEEYDRMSTHNPHTYYNIVCEDEITFDPVVL